jgi:hypothetical protein
MERASLIIALSPFVSGPYLPPATCYTLKLATSMYRYVPPHLFIQGKVPVGTSPMQVAEPSNPEHNEGGVMGSFIGRATIISWIRRARSLRLSQHMPVAPPPGVAWPLADAGKTQLTLNEKARVFRNGDGETRPPILPNRFHQACVQKDDLACAEQLYALGALSISLIATSKQSRNGQIVTT